MFTRLNNKDGDFPHPYCLFALIKQANKAYAIPLCPFKKSHPNQY